MRNVQTLDAIELERQYGHGLVTGKALALTASRLADSLSPERRVI
jgi:hypothetical protein